MDSHRVGGGEMLSPTTCTGTLSTGLGRVPCAHTIPCPLHGGKQHRLSDEDFDALVSTWTPWSERASDSYAGVSPIPRSPRGTPAVPAPRLFEEDPQWSQR
jgi:hypothetical protein